MGMYDMYGKTQLKVGESEMKWYRVGEETKIPDGVYLGWEGVVVVVGGRFVAEFPVVCDKWGNCVEVGRLLDRLAGSTRLRG